MQDHIDDCGWDRSSSSRLTTHLAGEFEHAKVNFVVLTRVL